MSPAAKPMTAMPAIATRKATGGDREPEPDPSASRSRPAQRARTEAARSGAPERPDRNGEYRANRRPPARRPERQDEPDEERIALDVLPPAISAANEEAEAEAPARAPRARRPRRPRDEESLDRPGRLWELA